MNTCAALVPANTYTDAHRCLKRHGLRRGLCAHHRTKRAAAKVRKAP